MERFRGDEPDEGFEKWQDKGQDAFLPLAGRHIYGQGSGYGGMVTSVSSGRGKKFKADLVGGETDSSKNLKEIKLYISQVQRKHGGTALRFLYQRSLQIGTR